VEHALPNPPGLPSPPSHPWRTIAVVAAGIATLELLGLVVVGVALLAKPAMHRARAAATPTPTRNTQAKEPARPLLPRRSISVAVLNGNGVAGAAAAQASRVRARGYMIGQVGNAPRSGYGRSVIMYRAGRRPEAFRLARDLRIRIVSPLDGLRPRDLLGAHLAVVVGG
jgi:LytR cell envelope-related transcriptional attenuator